ncbi:MAG: hypothetical protein K4305_10480 [Chlorobium sp.]|uniref:hypothetical protein n=1 Tax=Chlorobium sp. TaxID=1095 RepID=UPI002F3F047C
MIKPHTCIYEKVGFEDSYGEHILQNFLGARWVSKKIVCNEAQSQFGSSIDVALEKGLQEFRNLLGSKGGRGGDGPTLKGISDTEGVKYNLKPGGIPEVSAPVIKSQEIPFGTHIKGIIGNTKQLEWLVHELNKYCPNANIDLAQIRANITSEQGYLESYLHLQPTIGGADYFRGLLKSAFNLLGANASNIALLPCFDCVRNFILNGSGSADTFIRWYSSFPETDMIPILSNFDHFVCVYSNGCNVDGLVQFFGGIGHIIRLADSYEGEKFKFGYLVNPLRDSEPAETRIPDFNSALVPQFDDGYIKPGQEVRTVYKAIIDAFLIKYSELSVNKEICRIIDEEINSNDQNETIQQIGVKIAEKLALFIASRNNRKNEI